MGLSFEELRGRTVIDSAGAVLGRVESILFDPDLNVHAIRVKLRDDVAEELGVPRGLLRAAVIDLSRAHIQAVGDTVVLNVHLGDLARGRAPSHTPEPAPH
jgi:sporulation protein YlmC with PRC-barrel domain